MAWVSISSDASMATTSYPRPASRQAMVPVPQARSSTVRTGMALFWNSRSR